MKFILIPNIIFLMLLTRCCFAQDTYKLNIKTDRNIDLINSRPMENGDCLIAAYDDYATPSTILRFARINGYGETVWSKYFYTPGYYSYDMCLTGTKDNGFIAVTRLDSANKYGLALQVFKCDSSGNIQWQKKILPDSKTGIFPTKIIQKKDGGYYLVYDEIKFTALARFDMNGTLLWLKGFDATLTDYGYSVNALSESDDGGALIALSHVSCEFYCINFEIYKFNSNGNPETSLTFNPDFGFTANASYINQDAAGTYKILFRGAILRAPEKYSYLTIQPNSTKADLLNLSPDILSLQYLLRIGKIPDGKKMFTSRNGFFDRNRYFNKDLSLTVTSEYYYGNNMQYVSTEKYDSLGRICPDHALPAIDSTVKKSQLDLYKGVFQLKNITGFSLQNSTLYSTNVDDITVTCSGKAAQIVSNGASQFSNLIQKKNMIEIYPNPAHDYVQVVINTGRNSLVTFEITAINGSTRHKSYAIIAKPTVQKINISDLPDGFYFLKVKTGTIQHVFKFLKD